MSVLNNDRIMNLTDKGMHVHIRERLPVSTEVEVEALDLPHSCPECKRTFPTRRGLAVHQARWCRPGQRPASRRGQLADKAVKLAKRKAYASLLPPVVMKASRSSLSTSSITSGAASPATETTQRTCAIA